jgi:peptidylprolyl isomerase
MKRIFLALGLLLALTAPADAARKPKAPAKLPPVAWRDVDAENTLVIDTNQGRIIAELYPQVAPQAVARVKQLARQHFYDGLTFFRVISGFMAQTGDPQNTGQGASVLPNLPAEFSFKMASNGGMTVVNHAEGWDEGFIGLMPIMSQPAALGALTIDGRIGAHPTFCSGVLGIARADDPNSGNSQFFFMRDTRPNLDTKYTAFGRVLSGQDLVRQIKVGEPVPAPQDAMQRVQVLADIPEGVRPSVRVADTHSAYFTALIAKMKAEGYGLDLCDVQFAVDAK